MTGIFPIDLCFPWHVWSGISPPHGSGNSLPPVFPPPLPPVILVYFPVPLFSLFSFCLCCFPSISCMQLDFLLFKPIFILIFFHFQNGIAHHFLFYYYFIVNFYFILFLFCFLHLITCMILGPTPVVCSIFTSFQHIFYCLPGPLEPLDFFLLWCWSTLLCFLIDLICIIRRPHCQDRKLSIPSFDLVVFRLLLSCSDTC